jgi:Zn finger protein HypA/HybF involved in hydrogenase expression
MGETESSDNKQFRCEQCGGEMSFSPGNHTQACGYCGHENRIDVVDEDVRELDFHAYLSSAQTGEDTYEPVTIHCDGCGATTTLEDNVVSEDCPYCGSNLVHKGGSEKLLKPKSLLPFHVTHDSAQESF